MLKTLMGIGCILIASMQTDTVIGTPEAVAQVDEWIEAEITSVTAHKGLYETYYEVEVIDKDYFVYIIDDMDADYVEENKWIQNGRSVLIQVDDGYIEDMKKN